MPVSDNDAEHTIGRAAGLRPTIDRNMVYVAVENLKLHLILTGLFVRFLEILHVSARFVRGSVQGAQALLRRVIYSAFVRRIINKVSRCTLFQRLCSIVRGRLDFSNFRHDHREQDNPRCGGS